MTADSKDGAGEPWSAKLGYVVAFLFAAIATYFISASLRLWLITNYPSATSWGIQAVVALCLAAPIFFAEDRLLMRITKRDVLSSVRPITIGVVVGYAAPYALVA
jgi:hypothetical protein